MTQRQGQPSFDKPEVPREEVIAIRQARRYLRDESGVLARILAAYRAADLRGERMGYLPEQ